MSKFGAVAALRIAEASDAQNLLPLLVHAMRNEPHMVGSGAQRSEVNKMAAPLLPTVIGEGHTWIATDRQGQVLSFLMARDFCWQPPASYESHCQAFKRHPRFAVMESVVEDLELRYRAAMKGALRPGHSLRTIIGGTWPEFEGCGLMGLTSKALIVHGGLLGFHSLVSVTTNFRTLNITKNNGAEVPFEVCYEERFPDDPVFRRCVELGHRKASLTIVPLKRAPYIPEENYSR